MKRTVAILLGGAGFALVACGNPSEDGQSLATVSTQSTQAPAMLDQAPASQGRRSADEPESVAYEPGNFPAFVTNAELTERMPDALVESHKAFADELKRSLAILGDVEIGSPCREINQAWTASEELPSIIPVASADETGECVIGGWSYFVSVPRDAVSPELRQHESGLLREPIFGSDGELLDFFPLPDNADEIVFDIPPGDLPGEDLPASDDVVQLDEEQRPSLDSD